MNPFDWSDPFGREEQAKRRSIMQEELARVQEISKNAATRAFDIDRQMYELQTKMALAQAAARRSILRFNPKTYDPYANSIPVTTVTTIGGFKLQCYESPEDNKLVWGCDDTSPLGSPKFRAIDNEAPQPLGPPGFSNPLCRDEGIHYSI